MVTGPQPGKKGGFTATGVKVTDFGDLGERLLTRLGPSIMEGEKIERYTARSHRQAPVDVKIDGFGVEVKSFSHKAKEHKVSIRKKARESKEKFCRDNGLKPMTVMLVINTEKRTVDIYQRKAIGSFRKASMNKVASFDFRAGKVREELLLEGPLDIIEAKAKQKIPKGARWLTMKGRHVLVTGKGKAAKIVGGTAPPGMEEASPLSSVTDANSAFKYLADAGVLQGGQYGSVDLTSFRSAEDMQKAVGAIADEYGRIKELGFSGLNKSLEERPVRYMGFENAATFKKGPAAEEAKMASGYYNKAFDRIDLAYGKSKQWDKRGPVGIGGANVDFSAKGIYRHELGHHVYKTMHGPGRRELITTLRDEVVKNPKNVVSKYAKTSPEEAFSEAFSAFTHPNYATERRKLPSNVETKMKAFLKG